MEKTIDFVILKREEIEKTREELKRYEKVKKSYFITLLDRLRDHKRAGDEEGEKAELEIMLKMLPRMEAVINEEITDKSKGDESAVKKLLVQKKLLEQLNFFANRYIKEKEIKKMNEIYNNIYQIINNFIKFSESIESTMFEMTKAA